MIPTVQEIQKFSQLYEVELIGFHYWFLLLPVVLMAVFSFTKAEDGSRLSIKEFFVVNGAVSFLSAAIIVFVASLPSDQSVVEYTAHHKEWKEEYVGVYFANQPFQMADALLDARFDYLAAEEEASETTSFTIDIFGSKKDNPELEAMPILSKEEVLSRSNDYLAGERILSDEPVPLKIVDKNGKTQRHLAIIVYQKGLAESFMVYQELPNDIKFLPSSVSWLTDEEPIFEAGYYNSIFFTGDNKFKKHLPEDESK